MIQIEKPSYLIAPFGYRCNKLDTIIYKVNMKAEVKICEWNHLPSAEKHLTYFMVRSHTSMILMDMILLCHKAMVRLGMKMSMR